MCTLLTFALCANPAVPAEIKLGDLTVPIVWTHVVQRSCTDVGQASTSDGAGLTRLETAWTSRQLSGGGGGGYAGRIVAHLNGARIELTAYSWEHMSRAEVEALAGGYRATLWHEIGHVRTALATVDAINADADFSAPTETAYAAVVRERGGTIAARVNADQEAYDRAAEHGLRQEDLGPPLGGPNTVVQCPASK